MAQPGRALWFGLLTDQKLRRGAHRSIQALEKDIRDWIAHWNDNPRPFNWTKTADAIFETTRLISSTNSRRSTLVGKRMAAAAIGMTVAVSAVACASSKTGMATSSTTSPVSSTPSERSGASAGLGPLEFTDLYGDPSSSTGHSPDGLFTWTLNVDTISGGDAKVAAAFNATVNAAAQQQRDTYKPVTDVARPTTFDTTPTISFSDGSVSELLVGLLKCRGRSPSDLFGQHGGRGLAHGYSDHPQEPVHRRAEGSGPDLSADQNAFCPMDAWWPGRRNPGAAPTEANFEHWLPTAQGIEVHFEDYQFGHGLPVLTIPWPTFDDLLAPGMTTLRQQA